MSLFSSIDKKERIKVVLDIRSSSVGGAILVQKKNSEPLIKYTIRKQVFFEENVSSNEFIERHMVLISAVLDDLVAQGMKKVRKNKGNNRIEEVLCVFSSPWYKPKIKNFSFKKEKSILFTHSFLKKILSKEKETDKIDNNLKIIDKKIISIYMNGYETKNPFGKKAKQIDLSFYSSVMSKKELQKIEEKIEEKLNPIRIKFSTHSLVIISVIRNLFYSLSNFLVFNIGGENTEISLFQDSVLCNLISIPVGINYFIRKVRDDCSLDRDSAISRIKMFFNNEIEEKKSKKTGVVMNKIQKEYLTKICDVIEGQWNNIIIPPTIFVTVDNPVGTSIKKVLTLKENYSKILKINREPIVHVINNQNTETLCDYEDGTQKDALLSVIANFSSLDEN